MSTTRERIIRAAREIIAEDTEARPSVRAVASRAGIGASTLRYYFPTQRELLDAVLQETCTQQDLDHGIHDTTVPAGLRLRACIEGLLTPVGQGAQAREVMRGIMRIVVEPGQGQDAAAVLERLDEAAQARVVSWLEVLDAEGALPPGDNRRRAHFLLTVITGLSLARALPGGDSTPARESAVLDETVDAVLGRRHTADPGAPQGRGC